MSHNSQARYTRLAQQFSERAKEVSPAGSVTSRENDTQSFSNTLGFATLSRLRARSPRGKTIFNRFLTLSVSLRYFEKAEATAKAKYERLVKFVDFYGNN